MKLYLVLSSLLNLGAAFVLTLVVFLAANKSPLRRHFLLFLSSILAWTLGYALWQLASDSITAHLFSKILIAGSAFIPVTFYQLSLVLADRKAPFLLSAGYGLAALVLLVSPFNWIVEGVSSRPGIEFWPDPGPCMPLVLAIFGVYVILSAITLFRGAQSHMGLRASQMNFVLWSASIGYIGGATNFPFWYDIPIPPYGNMIVFIYLILVGYGLYSSHLFSVNLDIYKALVGILLNASMALFYVILVALYWGISGMTVTAHQYWVHGSGAFLVSILLFWGVPRLKFQTERVLDGVFRKERLSALSELNELPTRLSELIEEEDVARVATDTIMRCLEVSGVAIYTQQSFARHYSCSYWAGKWPKDMEDYQISGDNSLIDALSVQPKCLVLDQLFGEVSEQYYKELVELRNDLDVAVIVPVFANHEIYGLLLLGQQLEQRFWSDEEISILFSIGAQIGLNLRARDYERRSGEVDKLVALGTMAAGLAHEIRNPLVSVHTLASFVHAGKDVRQAPEEFKAVLLRDIRRIQSIVDGISLYSQNQKGKKVPISLVDAVRTSVSICRPNADESGVRLEVEEPENGELIVQANSDQLVQVLINLIENAIHAVANAENPTVRVAVNGRSLRRGEAKQFAEVSVCDNGTGVPNAILDRIFDPFITSKDTGERKETKGMGLGLAISKRIIDNHNGALTVANNDELGATFTMSLRCVGPDSSDTNT